jgi:hypothetical protein
MESLLLTRMVEVFERHTYFSPEEINCFVMSIHQICQAVATEPVSFQISCMIVFVKGVIVTTALAKSGNIPDEHEFFRDFVGLFNIVMAPITNRTTIPEYLT